MAHRPPVLAYGGVIVAAPFFGEIPTEADQAYSSRLWAGAAAALVAFPALALWCAVRQHRRAAVVLFGLGLGLGLTASIVVSAASTTLWIRPQPDTPPPRPPAVCPELSGGENHCPGD